MIGEFWYTRQTLSEHLEQNSQAENMSSYEEKIPALTPREKEILCMIAAGKTNQDIAKKLFININKVTSHIYNTFSKIEVSNRIQAALWTVKYLND
ncbi:MAG: LuxR C-terminal-related transcriptional regulator [Desulfovermiculus sp.]